LSKLDTTRSTLIGTWRRLQGARTAGLQRSSKVRVIQFLHVGKSFPAGRIALDDVSFHLERGEFAFLSGASGAGKTTLLKLIYREIEPSAGQILVNGRNVASIPRSKIPFLRRTIGVVFQNFRLISRKTVLENVSYLPRILGMGQQERKRLAYNTLRRVGLAHRMSAFPNPAISTQSCLGRFSGSFWRSTAKEPRFYWPLMSLATWMLWVVAL